MGFLGGETTVNDTTDLTDCTFSLWLGPVEIDITHEFQKIQERIILFRDS